MPIIDIQSKKEYEDNFDHSKLILYFTAKWCGPCKKIYPELEELLNGEKYHDIYVLKIDVELEELKEDISEDVEEMPTFHYLKDQTLISRSSGADMEEIEENFNKLNNA